MVVEATTVCVGTEGVSGLTLQAAVPKTMQVKLSPASGTSLAPGECAKRTGRRHEAVIVVRGGRG